MNSILKPSVASIKGGEKNVEQIQCSEKKQPTLYTPIELCYPEGLDFHSFQQQQLKHKNKIMIK